MTVDRATASLRDAVLFLSLLSQPGDVFELRGLVRDRGSQYTTFGYFDDSKAMAEAACARSGRDDGVYVTLNPVHPGLLSRAPKNQVRRAGNGDTTSDRDVRVRRSILVDVDPIRPTGISSTNEEHDAAIALTDRIANELAAAGWPEPIRADSGNGGHLIYAVDLPVDDGGLVKRVLEQLSKRFSTSTLKVDEKVFNPARISKIYGTLTRKGENTVERPHRVSRVLRAPDKLVVVDRALLEALAPATPARTPRVSTPPKTYSTERVAFDVDVWISTHLPDAKERAWGSGRKWLLPVCPFNDTHDREEAHVEQMHSGAMSAGCLHESCKWGWRELRKLFEPDAYAWEERRNGNGHQHHAADRDPPPEVVYQDAGYREELEVFAERDREPRIAAGSATTRVVWRRAPELVDAIWARKDDPWISLKLGPADELCRVRAGGIAVVMGGPGGGKSSLVSNMLIEHARNTGPAIALSIELPADELGARIVGIQCDASWEDTLRGQVSYETMTDALAMPRLYVIDRREATVENLSKCVDAARKEYPGEPILAAIDYAQLIQSKEREVRLRVADAFAQIDDAARDGRFVAIAVSQMSRGGAEAARTGEKIGAEAASLGAESAAIERFATVTLTIGLKGEPREDGSCAVEISLGKARMGGGDAVFPGAYWGKSGRWRLSGDAAQATKVRETRDVELEAKKLQSIEHALVGAASRAIGPLSRDALSEQIHQGKKKQRLAVIATLVATGELVEVNRRASRSRSWTVWTPDRVNATPGLQLVRDMPEADR